MFWKKKTDANKAVNELIQRSPGIRPAEIAKELNVPRSTITRRLPTLEEEGYHYSEDERGGLWPFKK